MFPEFPEWLSDAARHKLVESPAGPLKEEGTPGNYERQTCQLRNRESNECRLVVSSKELQAKPQHPVEHYICDEKPVAENPCLSESPQE